MGNKNLDLDFRKSVNYSGYCRNEVKWLFLRLSPTSQFLVFIATKSSGAALRKYNHQKIALAIAFSGIVATVLNGGQNAHLAFQQSLDIKIAKNQHYQPHS
ncbi:hypothetical protein TNCV_759041 [Trichonephila clavipes]|nr:hypothetical protein TNCV_759041 [Trichonephila clavipes]